MRGPIDPGATAPPRPVVAIAVVLGALLLGGVGGALIATAIGAGGDGRLVGASAPPAIPPVEDAATAPATPPPPQPASADCPDPTIVAGDADELRAALESAGPGVVIGLEPGVYEGTFAATVSGSAEQPITLCGPTEAILDGGDVGDGYVLHLDRVANWVVRGFTIRNGEKGLMADGTVGSRIEGLTVTGIGHEAIHLRRASTDNLVIGNTISDTGNTREKFGEGVYVGTAESNWCEISDCEPDRSDRNVIEGNTIFDTTAEAVDVKEGTSDGVVRGNSFDGSSLAGADSWVDVKGNDWLIEGNVGLRSPQDGFQTHEIVDGWGTRNVFRANVATVDGPGFGYSLTPVLDNVVRCDNTAVGAGEGLSTAPCTG